MLIIKRIVLAGFILGGGVDNDFRERESGGGGGDLGKKTTSS